MILGDLSFYFNFKKTFLMDPLSPLLPVLRLDVFQHLQSNSSRFCFPATTTFVNTNGLLGSDSLFDYPFTLLMFQLSVISIFSCTLYMILKPLGFPSIVNQILTGIILGPSFLCRIKGFQDQVFPDRGIVATETFAAFGFSYHMFLVGVRMDASMVFGSGKRVIAIGLLGWLIPVIFGFLAANFVEKHSDIMVSDVPRMLRLIVFTQSASTTAVISSFLIDLKILNSELGRLAGASSLLSDLCSLIVLVYLKLGSTRNKVGSIASVIFLWIIFTTIVWAASRWVVRHTPQGKPVKEAYIYCFIVGALAISFFGQATGQGYTLAPFAMGLAIPDGPPLGSAIDEKLSPFVSLVIMPIYFSLCGLKTNIFCFDRSLWGIHLIIYVCFIAKLLADMSIGIYCKMPIHNAFILALIMNSKGISELSVYNTWLTNKVLSSEVFSILMFSMLLITIIVSHLVRNLYGPHRRRYGAHWKRTIQNAKRNTELGILTCLNSQDNVPNIIQLLDVSNPKTDNPLNICVVHLVELVGRSSSLLIHHKGQGKVSSRFTQSEQIVKAFRTYEEIRHGLVWVEIFTSVSPSDTLHEDVCLLALERRSSLIIIPFHKQWVAEGAVESSTVIRNLNCSVLEKAPCSVGILLSHTQASSSHSLQPRKQMFHVCVLFFGGDDDREALSYGMRMVGHYNVKLTLIRITSEHRAHENEKMGILDNEVLYEFKTETIHNDRVRHNEEIVEDCRGVMTIIRSLEDKYDLVMVGRRHTESPLTRGLTEWTEHPELGTIGDILATYKSVGLRFILVVQHGA